MTVDSAGTVALMIFGGIIILILLKILVMVHKQTQEVQRLEKELNIQHVARQHKKEK